MAEEVRSSNRTYGKSHPTNWPNPVLFGPLNVLQQVIGLPQEASTSGIAPI